MKLVMMSLIAFLCLECKTFNANNQIVQSSIKEEALYRVPALYENQETLEFSLEAPFEEILKNKEDLEKKYKGTIKLKEGSIIPVSLETKGKTSVGQCVFPKLKVDIIDKNSVAGTSLAGVYKFKLGTHCYKPDENTVMQRLGDKRAVNRERFAYRLFDLVSPVAYKTRKAKITYIFSDANNKSVEFPAFILENSTELKNRISTSINSNQPVIDHQGLNENTNYDLYQAYLCDFFEKLIGNYDWSFSGFGYQELIPQNIQEIELTKDRVTIIPYDFDVAGTVIYEIYDNNLIQDTKKIFDATDLSKVDFAQEVKTIFEKYQEKIKNKKFEPFLKDLAKVKVESFYDEMYVQHFRQTIVEFYFLADNLPEFFQKREKFLMEINVPERLESFRKAAKTFHEKEKLIRQELEAGELDEEFIQMMRPRMDEFFKALP